VVDDGRLDDDPRLELLLHRAPLALQAGAAERQDDVALGRLGLEDVDQDGVADLELRLALAMTTEQLAIADHALALGADVDEDLVLVDPDDLALDDVTVLEALDVRVLLGEEFFHRRRLGAELARGGGLVLFLLTGGRRIGGLVRTQLFGRGLAVRGRLDGRRGLGRGGGLGPIGFGVGGGIGDGFGVGSLRGGIGRGYRLRFGGGFGGRFGFVGAGGGLVGDGYRRDGLFGRLVGDGGDGLRLRRGPALLVFGQGSGHSWWWICARESRTA
jgi:hypothetical protein